MCAEGLNTPYWSSCESGLGDSQHALYPEFICELLLGGQILNSVTPFAGNFFGVSQDAIRLEVDRLGVVCG